MIAEMLANKADESKAWWQERYDTVKAMFAE